MKRVQMRRGVKLPPGTRYVGRPSRWGNPYRVGLNREGATVRSACRTLGQPIPWSYGQSRGQRHTGSGVQPIRLTAQEAVACYRADITAIVAGRPDYIDELRGHDLACYCPLDQPCHADVLLELLEESA